MTFPSPNSCAWDHGLLVGLLELLGERLALVPAGHRECGLAATDLLGKFGLLTSAQLVGGGGVHDVPQKLVQPLSLVFRGDDTSQVDRAVRCHDVDLAPVADLDGDAGDGSAVEVVDQFELAVLPDRGHPDQDAVVGDDEVVRCTSHAVDVEGADGFFAWQENRLDRFGESSVILGLDAFGEVHGTSLLGAGGAY